MENRSGVEVAPSLLSADFACLREELAAVSVPGVTTLHLDVMDGHFVPNITFGPPLVASIRNATPLFLDTHLMISEPEKHIDAFAKAGSDGITIHYEATKEQTLPLLRRIRALGKKAGLSLNPETPWEPIRSYLAELDLVLVMTVRPGFGGQSFMADQMPKLKALAEHIRRERLPVIVEVDGGIGPATAGTVAAAGATLLVAGAAVFGQSDRPAAIRAILAAAAAGN